jgi:hypothetical protein
MSAGEVAVETCDLSFVSAHWASFGFLAESRHSHVKGQGQKHQPLE